MRFFQQFLFALLTLAVLAPPGAGAEYGDVVFEVAQAEEWALVQQRLNELGFDAGPADGQPGARTRYAVRAFQAANDRPATGEMTASDLDILFGEAASRPRTNAASTSGDFEILPDTDLPFGDYRSGKEDPRLKNISAEQCMAACQAEAQCQAFTYNVKFEFCFLKQTSPEPLAFKGAISGRRGAGGGQGQTILASHDDPDRYRLIGAPEGCPVQEEVATRLRTDATVTIDAATATVGDEPLTINWSRGEFPERMPAYLMVSTTSPVRFSGGNLYALTSSGRAAFDLRQFAGTTRAVIPLYGKGIPSEGTFTVEPLSEGRLELAWDVVAMTDCGEKAGIPKVLVANVTAGAPEIIFQNPFSQQPPSERIMSPDGKRMLEAFEGYYRLYDEDGYLIAERPGQQPRFSPTGRFASAWTNDYEAQIIDAIDGRALTALSSIYAIGWDNGDSFFLAGNTRWGLSSYGSPLAGKATENSIGWSCHACSGMQDAIRFDLENNYILLKDGAQSLTSTGAEGVDRTTSGGSSAKFFAFASEFSQTIPLVLPVETEGELNWEFTSDKPLTTIASNIVLFDRNAGRDEFLEAHAFPVSRMPMDSPLDVGSADSQTALQVAMRGPSRIHARPTTDKQAVLDALAPLLFARETQIVKTTVELEAVERREYATLFAFPGFPTLQVVGSTALGGCSVLDDDARGADAIIYGYDLTSLDLLSTDRFTVAGTGCAEGSAAFLHGSVIVADRSKPDRLVDLALQFSRAQASNDDCALVLGVCGFELKVFNDRHLVFWHGGSEAVAVYDGETRKLSSYASVPRAPLIQDVTLDTTGRWLVLHFAGELFSIIDLTREQRQDENHVVDLADAATPIVAQGMLADGELVVWNNDLQFDASAEGAEFVSVRFAGRRDVYALTQFESALRSKGMLAGLSDKPATSERTDLSPPPALPNSIIRLDAEAQLLRASITLGSSPLSRLTLLQDGLVTDMVDIGGKSGEFSFVSPRIRGSKWITLLGQDANGVVSRPYSTALDPDTRGKRPVRLVAVGIDEYADAQLPRLPLARADAINLGAAFAALPLVDTVETQQLTDEATRTESIRAALTAAVAASTRDETLVLSLSGHGVKDASGELYLATRDTRLDDIAGTAVAWTEIADIVAKARGRVVIFLDTCHSGIAGTSYAAPSEGAVEDFLAAVPSNIVIFSASKGREASQEQAALGGGVFTNALVGALGKDLAAVDANNDGALSISELYGHLRYSVLRDTKGEQTPWFARNKMVGDFAVF